MKESSKLREPLGIEGPEPVQGDFSVFKTYEGADRLIQGLHEKFGGDCKSVHQIIKGSNNGLFVVTLAGDHRVVAKFYQRDQRDRLAREYSANTFLSERGFVVAEPLMQSAEDNYGVYSYEDGEHRKAGEASPRDVEHLADFLVRLQQFRPSDVSENFPPAVSAMVNVQDVLDDNEERILAFERSVADGSAQPLLRELLDANSFISTVRDLTRDVLAKSLNTSWSIAEEDQRLSPVDFGFHNALFRGDAPPVILDLEYFGWDDPLHPVADFIAHDQNLDLSPSLTRQFLDYYTNGTGLPDDERERLQELIALTDIKWIAVYLSSLTPKYLQARSFASGGEFDEEGYIRGQIQKMQRRRERIRTQAS